MSTATVQDMPGLTYSETNRLLDDLIKQGVTVEELGKSARRLRFPDGSTFGIHRSPSDVNWIHQCRRAVEKAGLHWPLEDRKALKAKLKQKEDKMQYVMEYAPWQTARPAQENIDKVAKYLTGKSRVDVPTVVGATGMSQPTVVKCLINLGWLQESEREIVQFQNDSGRTFGTQRAYWSPAPVATLKSITTRATTPNWKSGTGKNPATPRAFVPTPEAEAEQNRYLKQQERLAKEAGQAHSAFGAVPTDAPSVTTSNGALTVHPKPKPPVAVAPAEIEVITHRDQKEAIAERRANLVPKSDLDAAEALAQEFETKAHEAREDRNRIVALHGETAAKLRAAEKRVTELEAALAAASAPSADRGWLMDLDALDGEMTLAAFRTVLSAIGVMVKVER